jgi:cytochrome c-type biogenesis protein CcmH
MVDELAARLARKPDDVQGWVMLGRAYQLMGRAPDAVAAFEKASALKPDSAELLASQADALAMVEGSLAGKPLELIRKALSIDPKNQTALALAATAAMENRQFEEALQLWQRLATLVDANSRDRAAIDEAIAQTRQAAASAGVKLSAAKPGATMPARDAAKGAPTAPVAAYSISGEVTLAPELLAQAKPDEAVFVFARALDGPPLPLAVLRATVKDLPLKFTLDDSMSMAPGAKLSLHKAVNVSARISRSGQAMPQPGDLVGSVQQVAVGTSGLKIRIADVVR